MSVTDCPGCMAMGYHHTGATNDTAICQVCMGMRYVDPDLTCKCGRAATYRDPETHVLFCGRLLCNPKKAKHK